MFCHKQILAQARSIEKVAAAANNRPIVYSLSPGGHQQGVPSIIKMAQKIASRVNMYRITGDDWDSWDDIDPSHFDVAAAAATANLIGISGLLERSSYPDLDMLPLGFIAAAGDSHHFPFKNTSLVFSI